MKDETPVTELLQFSYHVIDKKYELRNWVTSKMNALITINSILLGFLTLIYQNLDRPSVATKLVAAGSFLSLIVSLLFCLSGSIVWRRAPRKQGFEGLLERSLRTTTGAEGLTVAEYLRQLLEKSVEDVLELNVDLIQRLNAFITLDQRLLARGVLCTAVGLLLFVLLVAFREGRF